MSSQSVLAGSANSVANVYGSCSKPPALDRRLSVHFIISMQVEDLLQNTHGTSSRKGERKGDK